MMRKWRKHRKRTRKQLRDEERNRTRSIPKLKVGDWVLTRNMNRRSKFDPLFGPEVMTVLELDQGGAICIDRKGMRQRRHNDDIKIVTEAMAMEHPSQAGDTSDRDGQSEQNSEDRAEAQEPRYDLRKRERINYKE